MFKRNYTLIYIVRFIYLCSFIDGSQPHLIMKHRL